MARPAGTGNRVAVWRRPFCFLGVRRSGTTLLRVMLDRNSALAIPDESYFIPQLASRHRGRLDVDEFVDDLRRLPTIRDWEVPVEDVRVRIGSAWRDARRRDRRPSTTSTPRAGGRLRWGDKTPLYMQYLGLLDRLFPTATYAHLIRDGRDAAMSYLAVPAGIMTESWGHPRDVTGFACQWRTEVAAARTLGRTVGPSRYLELRYESFVGDPEGQLRRSVLVRRPSVRAVDARVRGRRRRFGEATPAEPHDGADAGPPRLAGGHGRCRRHGFRGASPATYSPSSTTSSPTARRPAGPASAPAWRSQPTPRREPPGEVPPRGCSDRRSGAADTPYFREQAARPQLPRPSNAIKSPFREK